jgi:hypothetical protein
MMGLHVAIFYKIARNRALVEGNGVGGGGISSVTSGKSVVVAADFGKKGDPTRVAQGMRESAEALVKGLGITKGIKVLDFACRDGKIALRGDTERS